MEISELSLLMGKRLKEERERCGLSHVALRAAILEKYGVEISKDSLINYEVSDENHTKAYKNNGMRIEYLRYLADFYGVSTDWLLGLSEIRTPDTTIQAMSEMTGLSEDAINNLVDERRAAKEYINSPFDSEKADYHIAFYKLACLLFEDMSGFFKLAQLYSEYYTAIEKMNGIPELTNLADVPNLDEVYKYEPKSRLITNGQLTEFVLYQMQKLFGEMIHRARMDD